MELPESKSNKYAQQQRERPAPRRFRAGRCKFLRAGIKVAFFVKNPLLCSFENLMPIGYQIRMMLYRIQDIVIHCVKGKLRFLLYGGGGALTVGLGFRELNEQPPRLLNRHVVELFLGGGNLLQQTALPSSSLIKLISKEFSVSEEWLTCGTESDAMEALELEYEMEDRISDTVSRLNRIRTRDNTPIRSRVIQLEELFANILDFGDEEDNIKESYYDICYKLLYHINAYVSFQKLALEQQQPHIFPFPDDLLESLKNDVLEFESFFNKELGMR